MSGTFDWEAYERELVAKALARKRPRPTRRERIDVYVAAHRVHWGYDRAGMRFEKHER